MAVSIARRVHDVYGSSYVLKPGKMRVLAHAGFRRCRLRPIPMTAVGPDNHPMVQLAIRCHPCIPVPAEDLEGWLERQLVELRATAPEGIVRLSRLTQGMPSGKVDIGWLIELELHPDEAPLTQERLGEALRDMRLLGLEPKVLAPLAQPEPALAASSNGVAR
jgi:hypothetical protein